MARLVLVLLVPLALSNALHYGPRNVNHSIAIVGGGPTGIYMAMLLKEKGRLSSSKSAKDTLERSVNYVQS